jgi:hypothetical protein
MKRIPALVAVLALAAAACGGSADADDGVATLDDTTQLDGAGATTAAPEVSREEALLAFTACLRDAGVDIDDPTVDADGNLRIARPNDPESESDLDREAFRAAREGCQQHLEGVTLGFRDGDRTEIEDQLLEFAACIRDNGYDMPDPDFGDSGTPGQGGGPFGAIDRDDPAFQAAAEACEDTLPGAGPGGGAGRFGGGSDNQ